METFLIPTDGTSDRELQMLSGNAITHLTRQYAPKPVPHSTTQAILSIKDSHQFSVGTGNAFSPMLIFVGYDEQLLGACTLTGGRADKDFLDFLPKIPEFAIDTINQLFHALMPFTVLRDVVQHAYFAVDAVVHTTEETVAAVSIMRFDDSPRVRDYMLRYKQGDDGIPEYDMNVEWGHLDDVHSHDTTRNNAKDDCILCVTEVVVDEVRKQRLHLYDDGRGMYRDQTFEEFNKIMWLLAGNEYECLTLV